MQIVEDVTKTDKSFPNVVMTVGSFDGIHLGHRHILDDVVRKAKELNGTPALLTMNPHPREYFSSGNAPNLLCDFQKKIELLEGLGIEVVYVLPFNESTSAMPAETFIQSLLHDRCHVKSLIVGHDCRFGKDARGTFQLLKEKADELGYDVEQVPPITIAAERVSSTLIRERILQGDLETVEKLLGRKYSVSGQVQSGRGVGATIGFPTANIKPFHTAIPAQGVYVAEARVGDQLIPAAVNIGIAPTIRNEDITIEAHLLDFDEDITGKDIEIIFHHRVRPERKFPSREALIEQITKDVDTVRDYFGLAS